MSTLKVNKLRDTAGSADAIVLDPNGGAVLAGIATFRSDVNVPNINGGQIGGRRNLIINGAMQVAQRGTSVAWASNGYLTCDRWYHTINNSAGRFTSKQTADSPDGLGGKCLELDVTTADTSIASNEHSLLQYKFEGQDVQQLAKGTAGAKKFTVSFYVKGNGNATYMCEFFDRTNTRLIHQQFSVTSSWSRVTLTFNNETSNGTLNNDNSHELDMQIWLHAGSDFTSGSYTANTWSGQTNANRAVGISSLFSSTDNFFRITGVQLEVGSQATAFEHRSYNEEIKLCERYFQTSFEKGQTPTHGLSKYIYKQGRPYASNVVAGMNHTLRTEMRSTPTLVIYTSSNGSNSTTNRVSYYDGSWTSGGISVHDSTNTRQFAFDGTLSSTLVLYQFNFTCEAEL